MADVRQVDLGWGVGALFSFGLAGADASKLVFTLLQAPHVRLAAVGHHAHVLVATAHMRHLLAELHLTGDEHVAIGWEVSEDSVAILAPGEHSALRGDAGRKRFLAVDIHEAQVFDQLRQGNVRFRSQSQLSVPPEAPRPRLSLLLLGAKQRYWQQYPSSDCQRYNNFPIHYIVVRFIRRQLKLTRLQSRQITILYFWIKSHTCNKKVALEYRSQSRQSLGISQHSKIKYHFLSPYLLRCLSTSLSSLSKFISISNFFIFWDLSSFQDLIFSSFVNFTNSFGFSQIEEQSFNSCARSLSNSSSLFCYCLSVGNRFCLTSERLWMNRFSLASEADLFLLLLLRQIESCFLVDCSRQFKVVSMLFNLWTSFSISCCNQLLIYNQIYVKVGDFGIAFAVKVAIGISAGQVYLAINIQYSSIMNEFEFVRELGSGSFGRVIKVRKGKSDKEVYAMKQIKMMQLNAREKDNALNEVRLLASIDSPNIISYKSAFFEEFGSTLCILMEYADGGDLAGLVKKKVEKHQRFSENFIWQVAFDILRGLKILHANHIIHRDIKPANVFFVGGTAKIGDLNVSKVLDGKYASTQTGTPYYTSPEIWNNAKYDGRVDIWSTGCLLYELAALRPPFLAKDFPGLSRKVTLGYYDPIPSSYSKKLADLIKRCLMVKMGDRPTAKELLRDQIFEEMENPGEGEIELLDTIRCPKMLKNLHLPESKSMKRLVTLKEIEKEEEAKEKEIYPRSLKKIGSSKNLQPIPPTPARYHKDEKENEKQVENFKSPIQSPNGYVKLPRINSQKNILY